MLLDGEDPCLQGLPIYGGGCGAEKLTTHTDYRGAYAQVLLGGRAGAEYRITADSPGCATKTFIRTSRPTVDCRDLARLMPTTVFHAMTIADIFGHPIIAGKVGTEIPLAAQCLYLLEDPNDPGSYYADTSRFNATVEIPGDPVIPLPMTGPGSYRGNYRLPETAGINPVTVTCTVRLNGYSDPVDYRWETIPITGVDLVFPDPPGPASSPQEITLVVGEGGDLARDVALPYRILPETYQANTAYLYLYKDGNPIILEPVETSGSGFATLARGLWLEPGGNYTAEVVLNQYSGAEIHSEVVPVRVVELELVADLNRDGNYAEGDPLEHTSPGLLLPLNNDDDDGDGVLDFDDGFDQDGLPGTPDDAMQRTNPDGTVIPVKLRMFNVDKNPGE